MTEPNAPNNWDQLISSLGIDTPSDNATRPSDSANTSPPQPIPAKKVAPQSSPRRQPATPNASSWDLLASELGVASTPVSSPTPMPKPSPAAEHRTTKAAREEKLPDSQKESSHDTAEDSPNFFDERFDFNEPYDVLESGESLKSTGEPAESPEAEEKEEKHPRRKRRRRRRGRDSEQREPREPSISSKDEHSEEPKALKQDSSDVSSIAEEPSSANAAEPVGENDEKTEHRQKRRRPRRRKKGRGAEGDQTSEANLATSDTADVQPSDLDKDDRHGSKPSKHSEDEDVESEEGRHAKVGFRGIPTWDEAVGLIITKNLESRAKRPSGGTSHGRGGPRNQHGGGRHRS